MRHSRYVASQQFPNFSVLEGLFPYKPFSYKKPRMFSACWCNKGMTGIDSKSEFYEEYKACELFPSKKISTFSEENE